MPLISCMVKEIETYYAFKPYKKVSKDSFFVSLQVWIRTL